MARCTLTFSPAVVPTGGDPVTQRTLFVTDGNGSSFSMLFDGDVTQTQPDEIPDLNVSSEFPGSCYLVDNNAGGEDIGNSPPSQPFTLDPGTTPPPPPPGHITPNQPAITGVQWLDQPQPDNGGGQDRVIDRRGKR